MALTLPSSTVAQPTTDMSMSQITSTIALSQPTARVAIKGNFSLPSQCLGAGNIDLFDFGEPTGEAIFSGYTSTMIWWNEPVPIPGVTRSECYMPEFLSAYTPIPRDNSRPLGSSIVPAMESFRCPQAYCTALAASLGGYAACCPS